MGVVFDEVVTTIEAPTPVSGENEETEAPETDNDIASQFEQQMAEKQRRAKRLLAE